MSLVVKRSCIWAIVLFGVSGWTYAGPLTGVNLIQNGEFEMDPPGTDQPIHWDSFGTTAGGAWDDVKSYGAHGGRPEGRPDQQGLPHCYGDVLGDGSSSYGEIGQEIATGDPGETWIGGWVYTGDGPFQGAFVKFILEQDDTGIEWESPQIYQLCNNEPCWTWHEFAIPAGYGFGNGEVEFAVQIQSGFGAGVGEHGMVVDGLELESLGFSNGACCLSSGECVEVGSESECLGQDPAALWAGDGTNCSADENGNGKADACEACVLHDPFADSDGDGDVDQDDFAWFQMCYTSDNPSAFDAVLCSCMDQDEDEDVDQQDLLAFEACASGPDVPADAACDGG